MELVIYGARQFGIKGYPSRPSRGSLLLKIETRSRRHFGNLWFFGNIVWGEKDKTPNHDSVVIVQDDRMGFHICIVGY